MSAAPQSAKALLFDKDGTLFDFKATWNAWALRLIRDMARGNGNIQKALAEALDFDITARSFNPSSFVIAGSNREVAEVIAQTLGVRDVVRLEEDLSRRAAQAPLQEVVPLAPLMDRLRDAGYTLGVMTNDTEAVAHAHLNAVGIADRFSFICGSDTGYGAKPDAGPLLAFCKHARCDPANAIMIGDSTHDLHAASAAGMIGVGVLTGMARASALGPLAMAVLEDIGEMPEWLGLDTA